MVRWKSRKRKGRPRFPRPRGDGPRIPCAVSSPDRVPPPTRGWSDQRAELAGHGDGSPAHAGMVRGMQGRPLGSLRFPRPRGDGPGGCVVVQTPYRVPPPTRGWSPCQFLYMLRDRGSPAHAGMVPTTQPLFPIFARFPRPRGDGPASITTSFAAAAVPPPTRGWSHDQADPRYPRNGSPAHAGMVPSTAASPPVTTRFPRPRGDGPLFL